MERASRKVVTDGALVTSWSPVMLKNELDKYLWRGGEHVKLKQVWEDLAKYLYLPRVRDEEVLKATIREGVKSEDYFGYATSVAASGRYEGLKFGDADAIVYLDEESVLVRPDAARRQIEEDEKKRGADRGGGRTGGDGGGGGDGGEVDDGEGKGDGGTGGEDRQDTGRESTPVLARRFYGVVEVSPMKLGGKTSQISQEVVQHLASMMGADVEITLEIRADVPEGIPEHIERTVSENCRQLKFTDFGFEPK